MLTQARLLQVIAYDPSSGAFSWKVDQSRVAKVGSLAGVKPNAAGYGRIGIDGTRYLAHRLAWLYVHGEWPPADLDHINRNRMDNRIANLRLATRGENLQNKAMPAANTSGHKGVYWNRRANKWQAQIKANGTYHYLGLFADLSAAAAAYERAANQLHTHRPTA
jgi:hypothetical protein